MPIYENIYKHTYTTTWRQAKFKNLHRRQHKNEIFLPTFTIAEKRHVQIGSKSMYMTKKATSSVIRQVNLNNKRFCNTMPQVLVREQGP